MDEGMILRFQAITIFNESYTLSEDDSQQYTYIPLINLKSEVMKSDGSLLEEGKVIASMEASDKVGSSTLSKNNSKKCTYIPLINVASDDSIYSSCMREMKGNVNSLNFLFNFSAHIETVTHSMSLSMSVNANGKQSQPELQNHVLLPSLHYPVGRKVAMKEWTAEEYKCVEKKIYASIKYPYKRTLIVWSWMPEVESEWVHAWIEKSGNTLHFHDRWICKHTSYEKNTYGGIVAVYPDRTTARKAAKEIPEQHELLNTIRLSHLIQCFVASELKYFSEEKTKILVHAKVSDKEYLQMIEAIVHRFGQVEFCGYDYVIKNAAVVFEVTYNFATHAFLAKTALDSLPFGFGLLDVEIKMTPKMKAIHDDFRFQLKKTIGLMNFPF